MNRKTLTKILAGTLAFMLTFANVSILGAYANESIASSTGLEEQDTSLANADIEFDAYFEENETKKHSKIINSTENNMLYVDIKTGNSGYLKSGKIQIQDGNFVFNSADSVTSEFYLNQIDKGGQHVIARSIRMLEPISGTETKYDLQNLNKESKIVLTGIYVNNNGEDVEINKTINVRAAIDYEAEAYIETSITKYVPYEIGEEKGVVLQQYIRTFLKNNVMPVKETKVEIEIPKINNIEPTRITVFSNGTKATNGEDEKIYKLGEDYEIVSGESENKKIVLTINNNPDDYGQISWIKNSLDQIRITYLYGEEANVQSSEVTVCADSQITIYKGENLADTKTVSATVSKTETFGPEEPTNVGAIVSLFNKINKNSLSKGYIYVEGAKDTEFNEKWQIDIGNKDIVGEIRLEGETKYLKETITKKDAEKVYKKTKINEDNFNTMLGEEGYVKIYKASDEENPIYILDKDNLEYTYEANTTDIVMKTSTPISEGVLIIENDVGIKAGQYNKDELNGYDKLGIILNGKTVVASQTFITMSSRTIDLEEPRTQATVQLSNNVFSNAVANTETEIRVELKTKDISTVLYKNPIIEIEFPKYVTELQMSDIRMLFGNGQLQIKEYSVTTNSNGNKVIRIELEGTQTSFYEGATSDGEIIVFKANISVDEFTPSRQENLKTTILNNMNDEQIEELTTIKFYAPSGIVAINQISDFDQNGGVITSISGKEQTMQIEKTGDSRTAKVNMTVINNYNYNCEDIIILGRIPFKSNKGIVSNNDLGSTFTTKMISKPEVIEGVENDKVKVYFSNNGEATKELSNAANGWTEDESNLDEVKSFMIVINDFNLEKGEILKFGYDIQIPDELEYNEASYATYAVYFKEIGIDMVQVADGAKVGLVTLQGPNLTVSLTNDVPNGEDVYNNQIITYTARITNNLNRRQDGVKLVFNIPSYAEFVPNSNNYTLDTDSNTVTIPVGSIESNSYKDIEFKLKVENDIDSETSMTIKYYDKDGNEITEAEAFSIYETPLTLDDFEGDQDKYDEYLVALQNYREHIQNKNQQSYSENKSIVTRAFAIADGFDDIFESNTITNNIKKQDIIKIEPIIGVAISSDKIAQLEEDEDVKYFISLNPTEIEKFTGVTITCKLPEELKLVSASENGQYNSNTRTITWNYDNLQEGITLEIECKVNSLPENVYEKEIRIEANVTCNESDKTFDTSYEAQITKAGFSISQTSNISDGYLSSGDEITYTISVKNLSNTNATITIIDVLPEELMFKNLKYTQNGRIIERTNNNSNKVEAVVSIGANETLKIYLTAEARNVSEVKEISNKAELIFGTKIDIESNVLTHKIYPSNTKPGENDEVKPNTETYRISGIVWEDSNKNGQRDETESVKPGIKVLLLENKTNNIVSNAVTDKNGLYNFSNVEKGKYVVAFEYDTLEYDLTTYQAKDVDLSVNSDVINMILDIDGKASKYAVTDAINVTSNTYNIDAGLVLSPKFDLELTKSVSLMQVSNSKGTNNYKFNNEKIGKVEIPSKEMAGSIVAITYTFTIENKGAVPGYAKKIVDYIPKDLEFGSTLNPDWYQDVDGNLYNISLANTLINPGEKVEINLILTKTMTDDNIGNVMNSAEIYETSNDQGIKDIDSVEGNRKTNEDDFDTADAIITIKTGGTVLYIEITLAVLVIFAIGTYIIKKKVIERI